MTVAFITLKQGSPETARIKHLQERLQDLGFYSAGIDGDFGPLTKAAVIEFQMVNSLVADGILRYETEVGIQRDIWVLQRPILKQGAKGEEVKKLQSLLQKTEDISPQLQKPIKLNVGAIDGDFGSKTKAAVIKFQNYEQIGADGVVGSITWNRLSFIVTFDLAPQVIFANNLFEVA